MTSFEERTQSVLRTKHQEWSEERKSLTAHKALDGQDILIREMNGGVNAMYKLPIGLL